MHAFKMTNICIKEDNQQYFDGGLAIHKTK